MVLKKALPLAAMEKILKRAGADRVGEDAKAQLRDMLEAYAMKVGEQASSYAKHAGRKTVKAEDISLAFKNS
ncbi:histone family protein [Candidatus Woesearchaeota archaeon]|nr:histone family protein [Candidatus Woesearchaeota archaeon]